MHRPLLMHHQNPQPLFHRLDEVQLALGLDLRWGDLAWLDTEFSRVIVASSRLDTILEYAGASTSRPSHHLTRVARRRAAWPVGRSHLRWPLWFEWLPLLLGSALRLS